ncbi:unnamed protein product [Didymodactylos carnosus]|uniref:Uncharacterized protein n=1 Tax=Didymodactylos carnosus TaxID=1234261 RepID=A0A815A482_9BILA|nr:unnamed protein product [Didymodactylos carnosus]CAF1282810.1 unnamed protein product [Didymodactylos carnosus]CAF4021245.1 unnamed protein product [Didymodactylos carnosus]CAF4087607.1 unnamed protein product [Didymodactylos carnosus]
MLLQVLSWSLYISFICATHFDGGTITWAPVNRTATGSTIQIILTQTYTWTYPTINCTTVGALINLQGKSKGNLTCTWNCGTASAGYIEPLIAGYCTSLSDTTLMLTHSERSTLLNLTANDYFSVSFGAPINGNGNYRSFADVGTGNSSGQWNITCVIDLRLRPDGFINTPPIATVSPPVFISNIGAQYIYVGISDVDNDNVRCRWSTGSTECADVCYPAAIPASTILFENCTLVITNQTANDWYCAAIQLPRIKSLIPSTNIIHASKSAEILSRKCSDTILLNDEVVSKNGTEVIVTKIKCPFTALENPKISECPTTPNANDGISSYQRKSTAVNVTKLKRAKSLSKQEQPTIVYRNHSNPQQQQETDLGYFPRNSTSVKITRLSRAFVASAITEPPSTVPEIKT